MWEIFYRFLDEFFVFATDDIEEFNMKQNEIRESNFSYLIWVEKIPIQE